MLAVIVIGVLLTEAADPEIVAVPFPLSVKLTPPGNDPVLDIVATGLPVVVTVKEPTVPAVKVTLLALVIAGACTRTVFNVND